MLKRTLASYRDAVTRPSVRAGLAVAVACNLLLLVAYLWSRDGQVTTLHIEARGNEFSVDIDGRERLRAQMSAPAAGGIRFFAVNPAVEPATLGGRGDIESVEVRDLESGELLFESGDIVDPPRLANGAALALETIVEPWRDYSVDIAYRRLIEARVDVRLAGDEFVSVRIDRFFTASVALISTMDPGESEVVATGAPLELSKQGSIKGTVAIALHGYPTALALVVAFALAVVLLTWWAPSLEVAWWPPSQSIVLPIVVAVAMCVVGVVAYLLRIRLDSLAYVADEAAYIFQAHLFASGRVYTSPPIVADAFSFNSTSPFIIDYGGRWASFYPFGHPLALTPGALVGATWIVPPILTGVNVILLYMAGRMLYGTWTGLAAAALLAVSPFALMQGASYLSHTTAATYLLACLCAIAWTLRRPRGMAGRPVTAALVGAAGGIAFGLLFNTRPLTAAMILPAMALLLFLGVRGSFLSRQNLTFTVAFAVGATLLFAMYLGYNWHLTGDPLQSGYAESGDLQETVGFGGLHSVANGINSEVSNLAALALVLNGWPVWIGFALVLIPFMTGTRNAVDWVMLFAATLVLAGGAVYITTGIYYGPRYAFEALPFLLLLSARGLARLADMPLRVGLLWRSRPMPGPGITGAFSLAIVSIAVCLVGASLAGWLFSGSTNQELYATPPSAAKLREVKLDTRLVEEARHQGLENALVVVRPCDVFRRCYLNLFLENDLELHGDVVWAYNVGDNTDGLFSEYPCRNLFYADYARSTITPAGMTAPPPGERCS